MERLFECGWVFLYRECDLSRRGIVLEAFVIRLRRKGCHMSGSGSGSGGGSGSGTPFISVGGVTVQFPYIDPSTPYAQEILDISLCAAIMQMASSIGNSSVSAAIQSAAMKALGVESTQLAQETNQPGSPSHS